MAYRLVTVLTHDTYVSATQLGDQATGTMTRYPAQSHYHDTEPTSPCPTLLFSNAEHQAGK